MTRIGPDEWIAIAALLAASGCYRTHVSDGGGTIGPVAGRQVDAKDVEVPPGYAVEVVAVGLTYPSAIAFDGEGRPHVIESGYAYGEDFRTPRLLRIEDDGTVEEVASGGNPPWTGIDYADGYFYVAEGGAIDGGAIVRIDAKTGEMHELIGKLPSYGDHHTNGPVIGKDGMIYFSIGTATNAAVVGPDNASFGWVQRHPEFRDIPCRDIVLSGHNFASQDPRDRKRSIETGAFMPMGSPATKNQVVLGKVPCTGAVFKMSPTGGDLELVAWGLRNPYGLGFGSDGELYVTENSFDDRGSRPVWGTGDVLWRIEQGAWYGWPDYWAGIPLEKGFAPQGEDKPEFVLAQHPGDVPEPAAKLGVHASSNGFEVSTSDEFGHLGELFVAQFGDMAPGVGKVWAPVGFNIVRVDPKTGATHDFATNKGEGLGPASYLHTKGLERPNDADFDPSGRFLYVVDFGVMTTANGTHPVPNTGVVWRIHRESE